jgi:hypothetical protein
MSNYCITLGLFIGSASADLFAQSLPAIQTDRPDQTECPFIVPQNHIQLEYGFSFEKTGDRIHTVTHPSSLWKYGVNERLELRLITEFIIIAVNDQHLSGLNPVTAGFKVNMMQEAEIVPTTSFIRHLTIPGAASTEFHSTFSAPSFRFTMQHTLAEKLSLGYNIGAAWDGETPVPCYLFTITTGYSFSDKTGCYLECYGLLPAQSASDHRFDGGINYLLQKNMLADISGGIDLTSNTPEYYLALGFSFRLKD